MECSHFYHSKFHAANQSQTIRASELQEYSVKELIALCKERKLNTGHCVEKSDILDVIKNSCLVIDDSQHAPANQEVKSPLAAPCVVYLHGNCGCRLDSLDCLELCLLYGMSVFAVDLSGSGLSEGG